MVIKSFIFGYNLKKKIKLVHGLSLIDELTKNHVMNSFDFNLFYHDVEKWNVNWKKMTTTFLVKRGGPSFWLVLYHKVKELFVIPMQPNIVRWFLPPQWLWGSACTDEKFFFQGAIFVPRFQINWYIAARYIDDADLVRLNRFNFHRNILVIFFPKIIVYQIVEMKLKPIGILLRQCSIILFNSNYISIVWNTDE